MALKLPRFVNNLPIADTERGTPTLSFHQWWDTVLKQLELSVTRIEIALALAGIALGFSIRTVSASGPVNSNDSILLVDATSGPVTLTLPPVVSSTGFRLIVKKIDASANAVVVDPTASETIDGVATKSLTAQYDRTTVLCDGTTWWVIG